MKREPPGKVRELWPNAYITGEQQDSSGGARGEAPESVFSGSFFRVAFVHLLLVGGLFLWGVAWHKSSPPSVTWLDEGAMGGAAGAASAEAASPIAPPDTEPSPPPEAPPEPIAPPAPALPALPLPPSELAPTRSTPVPLKATPRPVAATPPATPKPVPKAVSKATPKPAPKSTPKPAPSAATTPKPKASAAAEATAEARKTATPKPGALTGKSGTPGLKTAGTAQSGEKGSASAKEGGAGAGKGQGKTGAGAGAAGTSEFGWYLSMIRERFYGVWQQPTSIVRSSADFVTRVKIRVGRDGSILSSEIINSSGNTLMDDSVVTATHKVTQIDALPAGLGGEYYDVAVDFKLDQGG